VSAGRGSASPESAPDDTSLDARRADPRYQRLMAATREAAGRGYDEVSMRALAKATRMSLTTIYQYCSSKDHLIAEAHAGRMDGFRQQLVRHPPRGRTAEARVRTVMRGIVRGLDRDDALSWTFMRAMYSTDPGVRASRRSVSESFAAMLDAAIGDPTSGDPAFGDPALGEPALGDPEHRAAVIRLLGHVVNSTVLQWVHGTLEADEVAEQLDEAVHLLLGAGTPQAGIATPTPSPTPAARPARKRAAR
jgi:AcrR family transcriptional regulator